MPRSNTGTSFIVQSRREGRGREPAIFQVCDALIINKIDVLPYFNFDLDKVREFAHMRNPNLKIFPVSAKTGEGMDAWCAWLREQADAWNR